MCQFDRTQHTFKSVLWTQGQEMVYTQAKAGSSVGPAYMNTVVANESQVIFSSEGSEGSSQAILTMWVDRCMADSYQCLITDTDTNESEQQITLKFDGKQLSNSSVHIICSIQNSCIVANMMVAMNIAWIHWIKL